MQEDAKIRQKVQDTYEIAFFMLVLKTSPETVVS